MDLKHYYQKIRDIEAQIADAFPLIVSKETPDGGKEGTRTEVPRRLAAKLMAEGLARLAAGRRERGHQDGGAEAAGSQADGGGTGTAG